jgi:hypothetical protein
MRDKWGMAEIGAAGLIMIALSILLYGGLFAGALFLLRAFGVI